MEDMTPSPRAPEETNAPPGHSRRLSQLTFDHLASSRDQLDQLDQPVGPLAAQPLPLIDRTAELAAIRRQLVEEGVRLLTLTGPAGVGKTRLALAAAEQLATYFRDGVVLVDFAPIREPHRVVPAIAQALTFADTGPRPLVERLRDYLHERTVLLLLDNFEHVLSAASRLANLLAVGPHVAMLVTSRTPLHLRWEHVLRVPPLLVPQLTPLPSLGDLAQVPAIAFFLERAHARRADFALSAALAPLVAQLVVHLDGLPLALELAAARLDALSVPLLVQQLGDRLQVLESPMPDAPARQRSLEAAVGWSYDLLGDEERLLFRCLGVFVGRVSLDAITAVVADVRASNGVERHTEGDRVDEGRVLPELLSLVEQSLLLPARPVHPGWRQGGIGEEAADEEDEEAEPAFGELETVREYAAERLAEAGELEMARRAHAHFFLTLAERANAQLRGRDQRTWFFRLEREHDNLRAALRWLLDREDDPAERAAGLRLAGALGYFWWLRGYHTEGARWLEEALARAPYREQGDEGDPAGTSVRTLALRWAGALLTLHGELERARAYLEEARSFAQQWHDPAGIALALTFLGQCGVYDADVERAVLLLEEALRGARTLGEPFHVGMALFFLGVATHARGHAVEASVHYAEALSLFKAAGDERVAGAVHVELGVIASQQGDLLSALRHLRAALEASERLRDRWLLSLGARGALAVVGVQSDPVGLLRLVGAADALRQGTGGGRVPWESVGPDQTVAALLTNVPEGEREAAYREGRALPAAEVVHLALRLLDEAASSPSCAEAVPVVPETLPQAAGGSPGGQLTGREVEVLRLVAQGLANKAIARQLYISPSTVNYHLTVIFNKLVVDTRAQAVAVASRQGLL